jgi:Domain of unknown function (DUF4345)
MTHAVSSTYLLAAWLFFSVCGLYAVWRPAAFAATLDLSALRQGGLNEIRAQYGGLFIVLGTVCGSALLQIVDRRFAIGAAGLTFGGVIAGRMFGLALDRSVAGYGPTIRALIFIDAIGCLGAIAALYL